MTTMLLEETGSTSKHLKGSAELLLIIPIKAGFVNQSETMSYAARLRDLLTLFFDFRKRTADVNLRDTPLPIDLLETIYDAQWTVLDHDRKLLVAVTFDRSWEQYFATLEDIVGDLLDALFLHCVGYDKHTSKDGFGSFTDWIRLHQKQCDFLYQSAGDLTTTDIRSMRKLANEVGTVALTKSKSLAATTESHNVQAVLDDVDIDKGIPSDDDLRSALRSLYDFQRYFPDTEDVALLHGGTRKALDIYNSAVASLLAPIFELDKRKRFGAGTPTPEQATEYFEVLAKRRKLSAPITTWLKRLQQMIVAKVPSDVAATTLPSEVPPNIVQTNILCPIRTVQLGAIALIQCNGPTAIRALLEDQSVKITWEDGRREPLVVYRNLALTYGCLTRMQLPDGVLKLFPKEFREGMEQRAGLLGDIGEPNHPEHWQRPISALPSKHRVSMAAVDVAIVMQSDDEIALDRELRELEALGVKCGFRIVHVQPLQRDLDKGVARDAFGIVEGASQPQPFVSLNGNLLNTVGTRSPQGIPNGKIAPIDNVALGEILLGYKNRLGVTALCADPLNATSQKSLPLFRNSTFMVMRKLEEEPKRLAQFVRVTAERSSLSEDAIKKGIVGASAGIPKKNSRQACNPNDFDYRSKGPNSQCPLHAHVRLANPRLGGKDRPNATPRILRRGFSYRDNTGRGLIFMAYNASIAAQFEVIQRWLNAANITGLLSWQNDILTGTKPAGVFPREFSGTPPRSVSAAALDFEKAMSKAARRKAIHLDEPRHTQGAASHEAAPKLANLIPEQPFVSLRWGLYLFVPAQPALKWLVESLPVEGDAPDVQAGRELIAQLESIVDHGEAVQEWKRFIEDPSFDIQANQIWAAIRDAGGIRDTPYGRLIANARHARPVLCDDGHEFSVSIYGERLGGTIGRHYLGLDAYTPEYREVSAANAEFNRLLKPDDAYDAAYRSAKRVIRSSTIVTFNHQKKLHVEDDFARPIVRSLAETWFGLPARAADDLNDSYFQYFIDTSRYAFQPHPADPLGASLLSRRAAMNLDQYPVSGTIGHALLSAEYPTRTMPLDARRDAIRLVLTGAVAGFSAPAIAAIKSVLDKWTESDEIGWLSERTRGSDSKPDLMRMLHEALARRPVPPLLYRREVETQDLVVVGLSSAYRDTQSDGASAAEAWLFGGPNTWDVVGTNTAPHACPARNAAMQVLLGAVTALLEQKNLQRECRLFVKFDVANDAPKVRRQRAKPIQAPPRPKREAK